MTSLSTIIGKYVINFCVYTNQQKLLNDFDDVDIYEFDDVDEFIKFRKKYPEKMRKNYDYALFTLAGTRQQKIIDANHYKRFVKLIDELLEKEESLPNQIIEKPNDEASQVT